MKNKLLFFLFLLLTLSFSACKETDEPKGGSEVDGDIEYEIIPASLNFDAAGGEKEFKVYARTPTTVESVESSDAWCQISKSGTSPVVVTVKASANEGEARNTPIVIKFKLGKKSASANVPITQKAADIEYTITPTSLEFPAVGGEKNFTVTVKSPATVESVESSATWCQVTKSGTSPVNVSVKVSANTNYEPRTTSVVLGMKLGTITTSATVQITQEAAEDIEVGVLINGIKWATRNVDMPGKFTAKPEASGMFYQWNRNVGWSTTDPKINSNGGTYWDNSEADGPTWKKANDPCPAGWRVPTRTELQSLVDAGSQWTTQNSVNGRTFGNGNNSIFLPAVGSRLDPNGTLDPNPNRGWYWSSTAVGDFDTYQLSFSSSGAHTGSILCRCYGFSVRCVAE